MADVVTMHRHGYERDAGGEKKSRSGAMKWGSLIAGSSLALWGLSRRSPGGVAIAAAGGLLAYSGTRTPAGSSVAHCSMIINARPEQVYQFWRNFENMPLFMNHLENVSVTGPRTSRWVAIGPMGSRIAWDAEITEEHQNEEIRWRSLEGSDVNVDGAVRFTEAWGNRGTLVEVLTIVDAPGLALAKIFGKDPSFMMRQDLRRLKALIETGETPTIEGQSHGPRTLMVAAARMMNPDEPIRARGTNIKDAFTAQKEIA
jgi:uncharacterized membrane protein